MTQTPNTPQSSELENSRRIANRIRDAYTLTEADGILNQFIDRLVQERLLAELDKIGEPTMQDLWPEKLDSYDDMIMVIKWYKNRFEQLRTAIEGGKDG